ncbi:hypothetical protein QUW35_00035 [Ligilactobacillus agilis]|uniref:hypothetical protein n=1 Tax=Ligilactobacillus agilis TaxID=1601 RepID=UPI0025A36153|nr:hypothetical protein [Ligilactobacillus agilis]MDM8279083.1 hypothetical protein [Ligilactobacillus agilis]
MKPKQKLETVAYGTLQYGDYAVIRGKVAYSHLLTKKKVTAYQRQFNEADPTSYTEKYLLTLKDPVVVTANNAKLKEILEDTDLTTHSFRSVTEGDYQTAWYGQSYIPVLIKDKATGKAGNAPDVLQNELGDEEIEVLLKFMKFKNASVPSLAIQAIQVNDINKVEYYTGGGVDKVTLEQVWGTISGDLPSVNNQKAKQEQTENDNLEQQMSVNVNTSEKDTQTVDDMFPQQNTTNTTTTPQPTQAPQAGFGQNQNTNFNQTQAQPGFNQGQQNGFGNNNFNQMNAGFNNMPQQGQNQTLPGNFTNMFNS